MTPISAEAHEDSQVIRSDRPTNTDIGYSKITGEFFPVRRFLIFQAFQFNPATGNADCGRIHRMAVYLEHPHAERAKKNSNKA